MTNQSDSEAARSLGKKGGETTKKKYGSEHFRKAGEKLKAQKDKNYYSRIRKEAWDRKKKLDEQK